MDIPAVWYFFCAHIAYTDHLDALLKQYGGFEPLWAQLDQKIWCQHSYQVKSWQRIEKVKYQQDFYQTIWQRYIDRGVWFSTWQDTDYPELLRHIYGPPLLLCGFGDRTLLRKTCVSIVGTRQSTLYGESITAQIIQILKSYDVLLVSGLAYGIDSIVHATAHELHLPSAGIIAPSLLHSNWGGNPVLKHQLLNKHLFLSETNIDERIQRFHFARRNRLIAGISQCTIVVEAPLVSGALITARCARDESRDVFVIPHNLDQSQGAGCLALLRDGAQVVVNLLELPQLLGLRSQSMVTVPNLVFDDDTQKQIYSLLKIGKSLDDMAHLLTISDTQLLATITDLVLKGYMKQLPDGSYAINSL